MNPNKWSVIINSIGFVFFLIAIPILILTAWDIIPQERLFTSLAYMVILLAFWPFHIAYHYVLSNNQENESLQKIDRISMLFLIAAVFSPGLQAYGIEPLATVLIVLLWFLVIGGTFLVLIVAVSVRQLVPIIASIMGVIGIVGITLFLSNVSSPDVLLFLTGASLFISSGVVYVRKKPNPKPDIFEFHELFHTLLLLGIIALHYFVSLALVS
ncbi:MAG: hemolysin III family protein [Candidatus Hodarchaeales archaeon]|jgi:hemolysin III